MDKLKMMSMDKVQANIEKIRALFPNAVTEVLRDGKPTLAVDFDVLKQELADTLIDDRELRYQFTWPDKQKAVLLANEPIIKTLRPVKIDETTPTGEDSEGKPYCSTGSVYFDTTQNLYIEGDNLEVLKLLQETYLGKIKMIYIDPPYNTGNDFVYNDEFAQSTDEYLKSSGQFDEQGNRLVKNLDSNGRFHTDWLNMIYPRLKLSKDLLADDGVIFISIDDNEQENLKKICDEIFGESNFIAQCIRRTINSGKHDVTTVAPFHEYLFIYAKDRLKTLFASKPKDDSERDRLYKEQDEYFDKRGRYYLTQLNKNSLQYSDALNYPITGPDGNEIWPGSGFEDKVWIWRWSKQKVQWGIENGFIVFKETNGKYKVYTKSYEFIDKDGKAIQRTNPYSTLEFIDKAYANFNATPELERLFDGKKIFDFPKSMVFLKELLKLANFKDGLVLDFFSGSATTAHAVMQLNAEDGGNRKFIMVQLPEGCDENSGAYKAGYKNICEIGKERIRRAGAKIKEENGLNAQNLDIGFRVLKLDESNMKPVYYKSDKYEQTMIGDLVDNIREGRTPLDLLFQVMLELGKPLSAKIEEKDIAGKHVFIVNDNDLIACFDNNVSEETVKAIAQLKPLYAVFRDSSLTNDSTAANFDQIFATYSPATTRKVL